MTRTTTTTPSRPTAGRSRRTPRIGFAASAPAPRSVLGACGDDGDAEAAAVCEPYLGVTAQLNDEPDPATITPLLDAVDENAPDDLAEPLGVMTGVARQVLEAGDFAPFETPEFVAAQGTVDPWMSAIAVSSLRSMNNPMSSYQGVGTATSPYNFRHLAIPLMRCRV